MTRKFLFTTKIGVTRKLQKISESYTKLLDLVSLLGRRRAVPLVLIVLLLLELRGSSLELRVYSLLPWGRGPVVLLQLHGVLRVELGLLLQPAVILLLILGVLCRVHRGLGRTSRHGTSSVLRWASRPSVASPGVSSWSLRVDSGILYQFAELRVQFCLKVLRVIHLVVKIQRPL